MKIRTMTKRFMLVVIPVAMMVSLLLPSGALGTEPPVIAIEASSPQRLSITLGKSIILKSQMPMKRVSVGSMEIADVLVLTPEQISVTGKGLGVTNVTLWKKDDEVASVVDVEVSPDISRLKETLHQLLPEEKEIHVLAAHDGITLSGTVSSPGSASQALALAEPYFPKKVVNLMKVESPPDVSRLREALRQALPEEKNLYVSTTSDGITLSGTVSSKGNLSQALALAESQFPKKVANALKVEISPARFKEILYQILPDEKDIRVTMTPEGIAFSGTVSSTTHLSQVLAVGETYFPGKVLNLLQVGGIQQVMLEVRVAEIDRSLLKRFGINFSYLSGSGNQFGLTLLNNLSGAPPGVDPNSTVLNVSKQVNAILRFLAGGATWTVFIDALKEEGLLNILAEPTLLTLSGRTANFLAGGEFPIPVPQGTGAGTTITIEYKPFGVGLTFTPTVLSEKKISMQVAPEVSQLDFSKSVSVGGFLVPSLTTRRVSTVVELADGQSFAIAGLLSHEIREVASKYPVLGEVPVLGALFRSSNFQKNETELVIIATPHLVKPLDMTKQPLPTDQYIEPDDIDFYLMGTLEGRAKGPSGPTPSSSSVSEKKSELEGKFGHVIQN
jgi:pilus assembly protein CpaC